jgi:hypothetical protein
MVKAAIQPWAAGRELDDIGIGSESRAQKRLASAHGGIFQSPGWDLDSFAPQEPDAEPEGPDYDDGKLSTSVKPRRGSSPVHDWR